MESRESVLQAQECEQEQFRSPCAPLFGVQVRKNINMDNVSVFRVERWDTLEKSSSLSGHRLRVRGEGMCFILTSLYEVRKKNVLGKSVL